MSDGSELKLTAAAEMFTAGCRTDWFYCTLCVNRLAL